MAEIDIPEIERWLASIADAPSDVAARTYSAAKLSHVGGERPKWCRVEWHNLDAAYRDFLVSIARDAMDYQRKFGK